MNCNIIKDLMVLYASGECSDESKAAILEHVAQCPGCREIWETMETDVLEKTYEAEKETEFQLVTKEIKKRNWRKIFKRTVACTLIAGLILSAVGSMYIRSENAGPHYVNTGNVTYWPQDDAWQKYQIIFTYKGKNYTYLVPGENIGDQLFHGKAMSYFRISANWDICEDKSKAAFNVQEANYGIMADLMLENNMTTMYDAGSRVEKNMYLCSREMDFFIPLESKEKVLEYYNDEANYTWTLSERIEAPITDPHPEANTYERENLDPGFTSKDILILKNTFAAQETISVKEDYSKLRYVNLHMQSKDGVLGAHMSIEQIGGQWYAVGESYYETNGDQYDKMLKLPESIGEKIDAALAQ